MNPPRLTALVVEDDPDHIKTICAHLTDMNVDWIVATNLEEATMAIAQEGFDLVILDLGLPRHADELVEADLGFELLDKLRLRWSREDLFVLVLTGASDRYKTVNAVLQMKGNAYVPRDGVVLFRSQLAVAIVEAGKWRERRGDPRLVVADWGEANVLIEGNDKVHVRNLTGARRPVEAPGRALFKVLAQLALDKTKEGVQLDGDRGSKAKTYSSRLCGWAESVFRCTGEGSPFVSKSGAIYANLKVSLATDPADRDDFEQRRRRGSAPEPD